MLFLIAGRLTDARRMRIVTLFRSIVLLPGRMASALPCGAGQGMMWKRLFYPERPGANFSRVRAGARVRPGWTGRPTQPENHCKETA